tara:strand:- start:1453 stop:1680 length:228 start_codon:yes stop_codon:yes gene_type:complete
MIDNLKKIINIVLENSAMKPVSALLPEHHLRNDLGLESLALAELTVRVEECYGVDVFEDGIVDTVQEILDKLPRE